MQDINLEDKPTIPDINLENEQYKKLTQRIKKQDMNLEDKPTIQDINLEDEPTIQDINLEDEQYKI